MDFIKQFRVPPDGKIKLSDFDPGFTGPFKKDAKLETRLADNSARLGELQYMLYAEGKRSLLIVLQALDAGGKDGTIRHVMGAMSPQSCQVTAFKVPSAEEMAHDFLWRIHKASPARGQVGIFNRSHYEDVLVVRVHKLVAEEVWRKRYDQINEFERILAANGTTILKFYLHISKPEQLARLKSRLKDPAKQWKITPADVKERGLWDQYRAAYGDAISRCSTRHAPWFVIPANHKWFRNLAVGSIVLRTLESMDMKYPKPAFDMSKIRLK